MGALTFHEYVHISGMNMHSGRIWCTHTCARHIHTEILYCERRSIVRQCIRSVHCRGMTLQTPTAHALLHVTPECAFGRTHLYCIPLFYGAGAVEPWVARTPLLHAQKPIVDTTMWVNAGTRRAGWCERRSARERWSRASSPSAWNLYYMHAADRCILDGAGELCSRPSAASK